MPEGPELHMAAQFVKHIGRSHVFSGAVVKSEVSLKNPDVPWDRPKYNIDAVSRGKEMKVLLKDTESNSRTSVLFHFGMSGKFEWTRKEELPKHAHLQFYSETGDMVLSFVDYRRFGRWFVDADWSDDRGPCVITEPQLFRQNILDNVHDRAFEKPLCEAMLNQKFFNGVGNYLRAEVLYRLKIRPFEKARTVLESLIVENGEKPGVNSAGIDVKREGAAGSKKSAKRESTSKVKVEEVVKVEPNIDDAEPKAGSEDLLDVTHRLANEVVGLGLDGGYFSEAKRDKWESGFGQWLQCYFKEGMSNIKDHNGRTMWYHGDAGPLAPAGAKRNVGTKAKKETKAVQKKVKKETRKIVVKKEEELNMVEETKTRRKVSKREPVSSNGEEEEAVAQKILKENVNQEGGKKKLPRNRKSEKTESKVGTRKSARLGTGC